MISIIVIYLYTFQNTLAKFNYSQEPLLNQELVILVTIEPVFHQNFLKYRIND